VEDGKMSTKILLVLHTPPPFGGGEIQAQNLKDYFSKKKDFYIYDYSRKNHSRSKWSKVFDIQAIIAGIWWGIKVIYLMFSLKPDKVYFTLPKSFKAFMRNASVIPFAKLTHTKILGELPGTSFLFLDRGKGIRYNIGLFFLKQIDEIRFLSPRIANIHASYKFRKPVIIENGISFPAEKYVDPQVFKRPVLDLLYIGAVERSKGIFNTLEALKICSERNVRLHFHVVGYWPDSGEEKEAISYIESHKLNTLITLHGILTGDSKWELLSKCAILVHPTYWDGVPLTILEALAIGLPVVSTNVGGIPDTIKNGVNGTILQKNNPEELSHALMHYNDNRQELLTISKNNRSLFTKRFDLKIFLNNMEKWFSTL
jgi:glycosyltransferase involved in cell wall biosynthesis